MADRAIPGTSQGYSTRGRIKEYESKNPSPTIREVLLQLENQNYKSFEEHVSLLIVIWTSIAEKNVYFQSLSHLFKFIYRESAKVVLSGSWLKVHQRYKRGLACAITHCSQVLDSRMEGSASLCASLVMNIYEPWADPALRLLVIQKEISDKIVDDFIESEPLELLLVRIECLVNAGLEECAIHLCRRGLKRSSDSNISPEESAIENSRLSFMELLLKVMFRKRQLTQLVAESATCTCHDGVRLIHRVQASNYHESEALAETLINLFLVRDLLFHSTYCCTRELMMLWCELQIRKETSIAAVQTAARSLMLAHASSSAHFYLFVDILWEKYGITLLPFYIEMFVRGLTSDLNFLEAARQADAKESIIELENHMADVYFKLSTLFAEISRDIALECLLSSFSLNPTDGKLECIRKLSLQISLDKLKRNSMGKETTVHSKNLKNRSLHSILLNTAIPKKTSVTTCDRAVQVGDSPLYNNEQCKEQHLKCQSHSYHNETNCSEEPRLNKSSSDQELKQYVRQATEEVINECIEQIDKKTKSEPEIFSDSKCNTELIEEKELSCDLQAQDTPKKTVFTEKSTLDSNYDSSMCCNSSDENHDIKISVCISGILNDLVSTVLATDCSCQKNIGHDNHLLADLIDSSHHSINSIKDYGVSKKCNAKGGHVNCECDTHVVNNIVCNGTVDVGIISTNSTNSNQTKKSVDTKTNVITQNSPNIPEESACKSNVSESNTVHSCESYPNSSHFPKLSVNRERTASSIFSRPMDVHLSYPVHHVILDSAIPGMKEGLLADFVIVLESLRKQQLKSSNRWSDIKAICRDHMDNVLSLRCMFLNNQLHNGGLGNYDSASEASQFGMDEFASFQSNESIFNDTNVDKAPLLRQFINKDNNFNSVSFLNLSDIHHPYIRLDKLFCADVESSHHQHGKHHRRHRTKDRDPKKAVLRQFHHESGHNHDFTKRKKKKHRKARKEKSRAKKHHSTRNKSNRDNKKKKQHQKKKKESVPELDYCSDFSSTELMRIVKEHSNSFSQLTTCHTPKIAGASSGESDSVPCFALRKKGKQVSFKKSKAKKKVLASKTHDKRKHSRSKSGKSEKSKGSNIKKMNSIQDYSHILEFSSVNQMQSVQIHESSVAVDVSAVSNIEQSPQRHLSMQQSTRHSKTNLPAIVNPSLNACSQEDVMNIKMFVTNKAPPELVNAEDTIERNVLFSSEKQISLKYVRSKTMMSVASDQLVPCSKPKTLLPRSDALVVADSFKNCQPQQMRSPLSSTIYSQAANSKNVIGSPLLTTLAFPLSQSIQKIPGKIVIPFATTSPLGKFNSFEMNVGSGKQLLPATNIILVNDAVNSNQRFIQPISPVLANINRTIETMTSPNRQNTVSINKNLPNTVRKVVRKYTCPNRKPIQSSKIQCISLVETPDLRVSSKNQESLPTNKTDAGQELDKKASFSTQDISNNSGTRESTTFSAVIDSEKSISRQETEKITLSGDSKAKAEGKASKPLISAGDNLNNDKLVYSKNCVTSLDSDVLLDTESNKVLESKNETVEDDKLPTSKRNSVSFTDHSESSNCKFENIIEVEKAQPNNSVTAPGIELKSPEDLKASSEKIPESSPTDKETSSVPKERDPMSETKIIKDNSSSVLVLENGKSCMEKQLQPLSTSSVSGVKRQSTMLNKADGHVSNTEAPTRSLTSISDAVRFSLMDMDDVTGSVENQVLQAFHTFPQDSIAYNSQVNTGSTETNITSLTDGNNLIVSQAPQTYQSSSRNSQSNSYSECHISASAASEWDTTDSVSLVSASAGKETDSAGELKDDEKAKKKRKKKDKSEKDPEATQKYWCEICHRGFFSAYNLRRHCRNVHKMDLPKGTSDVPFSTSNSQCLTQVGDRVICSSVSDAETQCTTQQSSINKSRDFHMQSPPNDPKNYQTSTPPNAKQIQQQVAQALSQSPSFTLHSPTGTAGQPQKSILMPPMTPPKEFHMQPVSSVVIGQTPPSNFMPIANQIPKPIPKFQMLPTPQGAVSIHPMPRIHQPVVSMATPVGTNRLVQPNVPIQKSPEIQAANFVQSLSCQVQQTAQCAIAQGKKQDQRTLIPVLSHNNAQEQAMCNARLTAELHAQKTAMQQFKKGQLSKADVLQSPIQLQAGALGPMQPPILNPQMQKLVQIRQAPICGSPEFALQLPVSTACTDIHGTQIKSPIQYFQTQVSVGQNPVLHSAVRQTLTSCTHARQNQTNPTYTGQPIQNEFLARIAPHSTSERSSCSQSFPAMSTADLCIVGNPMNAPIICQSSETSEGLEDLESLLDNLQWGGDQIASQSLIQHHLSRAASDAIALPIPIKPGTAGLVQAKNVPLLKNRTPISKPKAFKPLPVSKHSAGTKAYSGKRKSNSKKLPETVQATCPDITGSFLPLTTTTTGKTCTNRKPSQNTEKFTTGYATNATPLSCTLNENDSHSSDSIQCIEVTHNTRTNNIPPNMNHNSHDNNHKASTFFGTTDRKNVHNMSPSKHTETICTTPVNINIHVMKTPSMQNSDIKLHPKSIGSTDIMHAKPFYCNESSSMKSKCAENQTSSLNTTQSPISENLMDVIRKRNDSLSGNLKANDLNSAKDCGIPIFDTNPIQTDNLDAEKELKNLQSKISDCEKHLKISESCKDSDSSGNNNSIGSSEPSSALKNSSATVCKNKEDINKTVGEATQLHNTAQRIGRENSTNNHSSSSIVKQISSEVKPGGLNREKMSDKLGKVPKGIHFLDDQNEKPTNTRSVEDRRSKNEVRADSNPNFARISAPLIIKKTTEKDGNPICMKSKNIPVPAGLCLSGTQNTQIIASEKKGEHSESSLSHIPLKNCHIVIGKNEVITSSSGQLSKLQNTTSEIMKDGMSIPKTSALNTKSVSDSNHSFEVVRLPSIISKPEQQLNPLQPVGGENENGKHASSITNALSFQDRTIFQTQAVNGKDGIKNAKHVQCGIETMKENNCVEQSENTKSQNECTAFGGLIADTGIPTLKQTDNENQEHSLHNIGRTRLRDTPKTSVKRSCPCCVDVCQPKKCRSNNSQGNMLIIVNKTGKILSNPKTNNTQKPRSVAAFKTKNAASPLGPVKTRSSHRLRSRNGAVT